MSNTRQAVIVAVAVLVIALGIVGLVLEQRGAESDADRFVDDLRSGQGG